MPTYIVQPYKAAWAHRLGGTRAEVDACLAAIRKRAEQRGGNASLPFFASPDDHFVEREDGTFELVRAADFRAKYAVPPRHEDAP